MYHIQPFLHGERARLISVGLDVRLSGPDAGLAAGFNFTDEFRPEVVVIADGARLGPSVQAFLEESDPGATSSRWGLFYLAEEHSAAVLVDASTVGIGCFLGEARRGFAIGYDRALTYVGSALDSDIVFVRKSTDSMVLWTLDPTAVEAPVVGQ